MHFKTINRKNSANREEKTMKTRNKMVLLHQH